MSESYHILDFMQCRYTVLTHIAYRWIIFMCYFIRFIRFNKIINLINVIYTNEMETVQFVKPWIYICLWQYLMVEKSTDMQVIDLDTIMLHTSILYWFCLNNCLFTVFQAWKRIFSRLFRIPLHKRFWLSIHYNSLHP